MIGGKIFIIVMVVLLFLLNTSPRAELVPENIKKMIYMKSLFQPTSSLHIG